MKSQISHHTYNCNIFRQCNQMQTKVYHVPYVCMYMYVLWTSPSLLTFTVLHVNQQLSLKTRQGTCKVSKAACIFFKGNSSSLGSLTARDFFFFESRALLGTAIFSLIDQVASLFSVLTTSQSLFLSIMSPAAPAPAVAPLLGSRPSPLPSPLLPHLLLNLK